MKTFSSAGQFMTKISLFVTLVLITFSSCKDIQRNSEESEGKFPLQDRLDLAYQQEFEMTRDLSTNSIPKERLIIAENYIRTQNQANKTQALINWTERGPNNIGGRVRAVIFDKNDATGNTVFAGSVGGGLWKATSFKTTPVWTRVVGVSANLAISAIAQDPNTPNTIYIGTGEGIGGADAISGGGVYKSIDGGVTWNVLTATAVTGITSNYFYMNDIKVDANGYIYLTSRGYYCNRGGVFKSKDGGATFTRIIANTTAPADGCVNQYNHFGNDIQISTNGDVYISTGLGNAVRVYVSKIANYTATTVGDAGNYVDITPAGTYTRAEIVVAPSNSATVYGIFSNGNTVSGIKKSIDYGTTWTACANPNSTSNGSTQNFASIQAWYALTIAVDPTNANNIVVSGLDICRSRNGGTSFEQISVWSGFSVPASLSATNNLVHADHHLTLYESGSGSNAIFANDGGIYYSANMNNAIGTPPTFVVKNTNLNITQYYAVDFLPTASSNYLLAGAQDNGTQKLSTAGIGAGTTVTGGDGMFCHIDQTNGVIQISSYVYNYYSISTNSGASFPSFTEYGTADQGKFVNPTDYDDANNILYSSTTAGSFGRLSSVGAANTYTTKVVTGMVGEISAVKVDPNTPTTIFVAAEGSGTPEIYKITNANAASPTYTAIPITGTGAPAAGAYISCIDVEVGNSAHIIATCSNYGQNSVWETIDGGTSWVSIEGNLPDMPVRWCTFVPVAYDAGARVAAVGGIFLATEMGVWSTKTISGSTTVWTQNANNIGNVRTDMIKIRAADGFVAIATHGRGLFSGTLAGTLPVKINSFAVSKKQNDAVLQWQMAAQNGIATYEIQWSIDGLNFSTIGQQNPISNQFNYSYTHNNISSDNYYRIKFMNTDGTVEYSGIRYLTKGLNKTTIEAFPNPFINSITLRAIEIGDNVAIYNAEGKRLISKIAISNVEKIDVGYLTNGIYFVHIIKNGVTKEVLKMVK
jgi:hypothetical protein